MRELDVGERLTPDRPAPDAVGCGAVTRVELPGGSLNVKVDESAWPLSRLCDFAARHNRRRRFLVVSKVLGRHLPARPREMRAAIRALAARIPADLPEPILVVGLAETAVCLAQGIFEELANGGARGWFIHSTRQRANRPLLCSFVEPHSHAARHLIHAPGPELGIEAARSLVLVDDEVSTGTTLVNLAGALAAKLPHCEQVLAATLTDWSGGAAWLDSMPLPSRCVSLLSGSLSWTGDEAAAGPEPRRRHGLGRIRAGAPFGRLGIGSPRPFALPEGSEVVPRQPSALRILGTGEFTYPPFLLAEQLEALGHDVVVHATTRSPIRPGGPIRSVLCFADNYGSGVPNYLYNVNPAAEERATIVCHETAMGSVDPVLIDALAAQPLWFRGG
jgi:hypothetical protein